MPPSGRQDRGPGGRKYTADIPSSAATGHPRKVTNHLSAISVQLPPTPHGRDLHFFGPKPGETTTSKTGYALSAHSEIAK